MQAARLYALLEISVLVKLTRRIEQRASVGDCVAASQSDQRKSVSRRAVTPNSRVRRPRFLYATCRHLLSDGCDSSASRRGLDEFENGGHCFDIQARRCFRRGGYRGTSFTAWWTRATSPRPHRPPSGQGQERPIKLHAHAQDRPIELHAHAHSCQIQFAPSHAIAAGPQ